MSTEVDLTPEIIALIEKYKLDKNYGANWKGGDAAARRVIKGVETKDYALLAGLKNTDNKFYREVFNLISGLKLPKTQRDSETMVREFVTPESIEVYEWNQIKQWGEDAIEGLNRSTIEHGGVVLTHKQFLDAIIQKGFRHLEVVRNRSNRNETRLSNGDGTFFILKQYGFSTYAKYAIGLLEREEKAQGGSGKD